MPMKKRCMYITARSLIVIFVFSYSSVAREKQADYNANLKLFDQITSKSKIRSSIPMNIASEIRKASIDQIAAAKSSKASTSSSKQTPVGLAITFDKASLTQSSEKFSAILAKQPIDGIFVASVINISLNRFEKEV